MSGTIRFRLNGEPVEVAGLDPTATVLDWLRTERRLVGTKEGCAEGDCGACTAVLVEPAKGGPRCKSVNTCIMFLPMLDGRELVTVEGLGGAHPVQRAFVDRHASQCGFCTPGFVMALYALYRNERAPLPAAIDDAISGNLCRCTGYHPIREAAKRMYELPRPAEPRAQFPRRRGMLAIAARGKKFWAPRTLKQALRLRRTHRRAILLAGGTDVGLWVTKQLRDLPEIVYLGEVAELRAIKRTKTHLEIGGGATYADAQPHLAALHPDLDVLLRRLGGAQVRNLGTIGGNIANASPIGDSMPPLIALGAEAVLAGARGRRAMPLEKFFAGYRKTALRPDEIVALVRIPLPAPHLRLSVAKIAKRFDQDISAVCAAFAVELKDGIVVKARAAFGGMAAMPARAPRCERALEGRPWRRDTVEQAAAALARDFRPIDDFRASSAYRAQVAANLLRRFYLADTGQLEAERAHG